MELQANLIKVLVRYEFICQAHIKLIAKSVMFGRVVSTFNSYLIKVLVKYEFICQAHIQLITTPINDPKLSLFCIKP